MNMFFVADHFQMQEVSLKILAHLSNGSDKIRHRIVQVSVWGSNTVSCLIWKKSYNNQRTRIIYSNGTGLLNRVLSNGKMRTKSKLKMKDWFYIERRKHFLGGWGVGVGGVFVFVMYQIIRDVMRHMQDTHIIRSQQQSQHFFFSFFFFLSFFFVKGGVGVGWGVKGFFYPLNKTFSSGGQFLQNTAQSPPRLSRHCI